MTSDVSHIQLIHQVPVLKTMTDQRLQYKMPFFVDRNGVQYLDFIVNWIENHTENVLLGNLE